MAASAGTLLVLLGAGGMSFHALGALLAFGSALTYTVYILVADTVVHRLPPVVLSALVMTGAAGTLGARALLTGGVDLDFGWAGWFWLACITVVSTVVAMLTFFAGLKRTGPSTAAILSTSLAVEKIRALREELRRNEAPIKDVVDFPEEESTEEKEEALRRSVIRELGNVDRLLRERETLTHQWRRLKAKAGGRKRGKATVSGF